MLSAYVASPQSFPFGSAATSAQARLCQNIAIFKNYDIYRGQKSFVKAYVRGNSRSKSDIVKL